MNFHCSVRFLAAFCVVALIACEVNAQFRMGNRGNQNRQVQRQRQQAQNAPIELTDGCGPWLIMCASFVGEDAEAQSMSLVRELRQKGLAAYLYSHHFDYSGTIEGLGFDQREGRRLPNGQMVARPPKMKALHNEEFEEIAVLVGDFPTIDDGRGQETLQYIKYMMPESLGKVVFGQDAEGQFLVRPREADAQRMRIMRTINKTMNANADKRKGPMGAAFMMANPLLPDEYFAAQRVDEFVLNFNKDYPNTLLKNRGTYTVQVATFRGDSTFELDQIKKQAQELNWRMNNRKPIQESKLALALVKANRLTKELRKLGFPAFEFHDRHESYVCVGEFEWLKRIENGREIQNPDIVGAIQAFKGNVENFPGVPGAVRPKSLGDIAKLYDLPVDRLPDLRRLGVVFDVQPIPVAVPRAPTRTARR